MNEYEFTLKFRLPDADADASQYLDALAQAGCDDALVGVGQPGRIALNFTREAPSALDAMATALRSLGEAIPGAELVEASPDFVGITDVAELAGCSRQNIRKLMLSHVGTFPTAVHEGSPTVWHLAPVLQWLSAHQRRCVDRTLIEVAEAAMKVNIAKELRRIPGATLPKELAPLFA